MGQGGIFDPLGYSFALPHSELFHPLGFPFRISTNSTDVLLAAEELWRGYPQFFSETPAEVAVAVDEDPPEAHAESLVLRGKKHLLTMVSDARNFAALDCAQRFALCWITAATARDRPWFRYFYLDTIANLMLWHTHMTRIHAGCVALNGQGVLLCGPSGAGKSCLTYACAKRGWTLISDEAPSILRGTPERIVFGKPHLIHLRDSAFELFPELAGRQANPNPVGKISLEIHTSEISDVRTAYRVCVAAVVFLNRQDAPVRLAPMDREEAWRRLEADLPLFEQSVHEEHKASLRNVLQAPVYELSYRDLDGAVEELERMIRGGGR